MMNIDSIWKIILSWFCIVCILFLLTGNSSIAIFGLTYGIGFAALSLFFKERIKDFLSRQGFRTAFGFFALALLATIFEESYCFFLGNKIAHPNLLIDILFVYTIWLGWFGAWYFFLSKKYKFNEKEALFAAGLSGIMYEYAGKPEFLANPTGILIVAPLAIVIYATLFIIPMQAIDFTGKEDGWTKYIAAMLLPFIISLPIAILDLLVLAVFKI